MNAIEKYARALLGCPPSLADQWREAAKLIDQEADAASTFSLYSRKCAQAAMLRNCATQLEALLKAKSE